MSRLPAESTFHYMKRSVTAMLLRILFVVPIKLRWVILLTMIFYITPLYADDQFSVPSPAEFAVWADQAAKFNEELKQKIDEIDDNLEIVFIPGILGSQLSIGDYVYGKDPINASKLVFDPEQKVSAATLNEFQAVIDLKIIFKTKVDIYGSGLDDLKASSKGREAKVFAYDWRDDIKNTAEKFHEFARQTLNGKRVIIFAHSMGGLVAWQWKNTHRNDRPFTLIAIVLIGSPIQGSCEPARMLVEGYSAPEGNNVFEKIATHLVFDHAHPAIFTFPSVFQLLPRFNKDFPCISLKLHTDLVMPQDHHLVDTWIGRDGGSYKIGGTENSERKKFFEETALDEKTYIERVKKAINAGRRFRADFDLGQHNDQVYYLYSDEIDMDQTYSVTVSKGWLKIDNESDLKYRKAKGDGRVPYESAINYGQADRLHGPTFMLHEEHGKLLSDRDFPKFVTRDIDSIIMQSKHLELFAFAANIPELRTEMHRRRWLGDPRLPADSLASDVKIVSARKIVAQYTAEQIPRTEINSLEGLNNYAVSILSNFKGTQIKRDSIVAALLDSSILLSPVAANVDTLDTLGTIRYRQGFNNNAIYAYNEAIKNVKSEIGSHKESEPKAARLYRSLGDV
jgi:hypothetical protein